MTYRYWRMFRGRRYCTTRVKAQQWVLAGSCVRRVWLVCVSQIAATARSVSREKQAHMCIIYTRRDVIGRVVSRALASSCKGLSSSSQTLTREESKPHASKATCIQSPILVGRESELRSRTSSLCTYIYICELLHSSGVSEEVCLSCHAPAPDYA